MKKVAEQDKFRPVSHGGSKLPSRLSMTILKIWVFITGSAYTLTLESLTGPVYNHSACGIKYQ
jgi:hypothetical protein